MHVHWVGAPVEPDPPAWDVAAGQQEAAQQQQHQEEERPSGGRHRLVAAEGSNETEHADPLRRPAHRRRGLVGPARSRVPILAVHRCNRQDSQSTCSSRLGRPCSPRAHV